MPFLDDLKKMATEIAGDLCLVVAKQAKAEQLNVSAAQKAVTILKNLGMTEALGLLWMILTCHFAIRGQDLPASISELCRPASPPLPAEVMSPVPLIRTDQKPSEKPLAVVVDATKESGQASFLPKAATARTLETGYGEIPENRLRKFVGFCETMNCAQFIDDQKLAKTRNFARNLFSERIEWVRFVKREQWETIFSCMTKLARLGKYLLWSEERILNAISSAPSDLLRGYLFGQDNALTRLMADFSEMKDADAMMPNWLIAKTHFVIDLGLILDCSDEYLSGQEMDHFAQLLEAVETARGPDPLIKKLKGLVFYEDEDGEKNFPSSKVAVEKLQQAGDNEAARREANNIAALKTAKKFATVATNGTALLPTAPESAEATPVATVVEPLS